MAEIQKCTKCGTELPSDGICVRCTLNEGTHSPTKTDSTVEEWKGQFKDSASPADLFEPAGDKPGDRIGPYKLLQQIGEGGMGTVWMAERTEQFQQRVALKVIKLGMDSKQVIGRFEAERQALAMMNHPNIAKVLDAGATQNGRPYFVMELVKGIAITDYCNQNKLSTRERLALFVQICQAIQHAHSKLIIHRDIKPSNILVAEYENGEPVPKVIDFGIAKATGQLRLTEKTVFTELNKFIGTTAYMSPEQAQLSALDIDTRSDIYSLGVLLYELLTGKTPFDPKRLQAAGLDEMRRIIREEEPPRPSTRISTLEASEQTSVARQRQVEPPKLLGIIRGDLDWIVMKCLDKDRRRRYATANGLAREIERHLNNEPLEDTREPSRFYRFQKLVRRNKLGFAAAGGITAALIAGIMVSTWQFIDKSKAYERVVVAEQEQRRLREAAERAREGEVLARQQAEASQTAAQTQAERAKAATIEAKNALSASDYLQAVRLSAEDSRSDALAYLARSIRFNPANEAALMRLTTLLTYHSWFRPTLTIKGDEEAGPYGSQSIPILAFRSRVAEPQYSPDGSRIVTTMLNNTARVWDARTGHPVSEIMRHAGAVSSAHFSPDGNRVVTSSEDGTARAWDAQTGQPLTEPLKHDAQVWSAQFSPDGTRIVTASADQTARLWDARSGQLIKEPLLHSNWVNFAEFSPDGKFIVTVSGDNAAHVWDAQSGKQAVLPLRHSREIQSAHFSPDSRQIVTASDDFTARVWDGMTGKMLTTLKHDQGVRSARFSPDGKRIVTASWDTTARLWDAQSGRPVGERLRHSGPVASAQFSPDGQRVVTASADYTARMWDAQSGRPLIESLKHEQGIHSAQFSPNGNEILTASRDKTARVWVAWGGGSLPAPLKYFSQVSSAGFSAEGNRLVTNSWDDTVRVWIARSGGLTNASLEYPATVNSIQSSPDGNLIVTSQDDTARVWDAQAGTPRSAEYKHSETVKSAQFSPDGKRVVTASEDNTARVWDVESGQPLGQPMQHGGVVLSAHFSPDGKRIVTASEDNTARVWDAESGFPLTEPLRHASTVNFAQFSPDGKRIVTVSADLAVSTEHTLRVWNALDGHPLTEPLKYSSKVDSAQFGSDGKQLVAISDDLIVQVWDVGPLGKCPEWLLKLTEAIAGQVLNKEGVLERSKLDPDQVIASLRQDLDAEPGANDWVVWGRWFLAEPSRRTISPFSKITFSEYVEILIKDNNIASEDLAELERLASGNPELSRRLSEVSTRLSRTTKVAELEQQASAFAREDKLGEAETTYREALALQRKLSGNEDRLVARITHHLADVLRRKKTLAEARSLGEEAAALYERHAEWPTNEQQHSLQILGEVLKDLGDLSGAEALHRKRVQDLRARLPSDDPNLAAAIAQLASSLLDQGKFREAEPLARECLEVREKKFPDAWQTFSARSLLGGSLLGQKKSQEAEPMLLSAYEGMKQKEDPNVKRPLEETLQRLVRLYEAMNQPDKTAEWRRKLQEIAIPQKAAALGPDAR